MDAAALEAGAPDAFFCPISFRLFRDPVMLATGQTCAAQSSHYTVVLPSWQQLASLLTLITLERMLFFQSCCRSSLRRPAPR